MTLKDTQHLILEWKELASNAVSELAMSNQILLPG